MQDKIICLVGASGSGKTTIAKELEKLGYSIIHSYTNREEREPNEWGHTFIVNSRFEGILGIVGNISNKEQVRFLPSQMIAFFNNYEKDEMYFATYEQYQGKGTSIYIVDPEGTEMVKKNVKDAEVITIFLMVDKSIRRERLAKRHNIKLGHSAKEHFELQEDTERLDEYFKILKEIQDRVTKDKEIFKTCKCDYVVDANRELEEVVADVIEIIGGGNINVHTTR